MAVDTGRDVEDQVSLKAKKSTGFRARRSRREDDRDFYSATQWQLVWWRFRKHRLAMAAAFILFLYFLIVLLGDFIAPYSGTTRDTEYVNGPPEILSVWDEGPALPHVDRQLSVRGGVEDGFRFSVEPLEGTKPIRWLVRGEEWSFFGLKTDWHLFGAADYEITTLVRSPEPRTTAPIGTAGDDEEEDPFAAIERDSSGRFQIGVAPSPTEETDPTEETGLSDEVDPVAAEEVVELETVTRTIPGFVHLLGTDDLGRDQLSRIIVATRTSLTVGIIGLSVAFVLGLLFGGIAGFFGGWIDYLIQRLIEIIRSIPTIPLVMALAAAFPEDWSNQKVFFFVSIILGLVGWTTLGRRIRTMLLTLRDEDYVVAARLSGAKTSRIIGRHMLPSFFSYIIVTLAIEFPYMILAESVLSFVGLGLRPPSISWGVLLQNAQRVEVLEQTPWLLLPALFVVIAILAFNFLGDGLRDALDPYGESS